MVSVSMPISSICSNNFSVLLKANWYISLSSSQVLIVHSASVIGSAILITATDYVGADLHSVETEHRLSGPLQDLCNSFTSPVRLYGLRHVVEQ